MEKTSDSLIKVCALSELPSGQAKYVQVNGKEVGIFNANGKLFAINNICIHAGGRLNEGYIDCEKAQVVCPWHAWNFDLATGKCISHPRQDIFADIYTVKIQNDEVFVEVK